MLVWTHDDKRKGLIFLDHPRMASTSVRDALVASPGTVVQVGAQHQFEKTFEWHLPQFIKLCIIRDPFEVMASWGQVYINRGIKQSFVEMIRAFPTDNAQYCVGGRLFYMAPLADLVIPLPELGEKWMTIADRWGLRYVGRSNQTVGRQPKEAYYDEYPDAWEAVADTFPEDVVYYQRVLGDG